MTASETTPDRSSTPFRLERIRIAGFRNIETAELSFDARFTLLFGDNAMGKTNALEAVGLLGDLRSFRNAKRRSLIATDAEEARIRARLLDGDLPYDAAIRLDARQRTVEMNGKAVTRNREFVGRFPMIVFTPEDIGLPKGPPEDRRRFLDRAVFLLRPSHLSRLTEYRRYLQRRNLLLREPNPDRNLMAVYDGRLSELGAELERDRRYMAGLLEREANRILRGVSGGGETLRLRYRSGTDRKDDAPPTAERLAARLKAAWEADRRRGFTSRGPHADDWTAELSGHPAASHASQGQLRSLAVSLKIAKMEIVRQRRNMTPILLIDDLSSELDERRRERLFAYLSDGDGQVLLTATGAKPYFWLPESDRLAYRVENGTFRRLEEGAAGKRPFPVFPPGTGEEAGP